MPDSTHTITAEGAGHTLRLVRRFPASRERVWRAFTERDEVAAWFGPEGFGCEIHHWDARPGGRWAATMIAPDGKRYPVSASVREVRPPERLVYTWVWGAQHGDEVIEERETLVTVELRSVGDMTELTLLHSNLRSAESAESHAGGWGSSMNKLDSLLTA